MNVRCWSMIRNDPKPSRTIKWVIIAYNRHILLCQCVSFHNRFRRLQQCSMCSCRCAQKERCWVHIAKTLSQNGAHETRKQYTQNFVGAWFRDARRHFSWWVCVCVKHLNRCKTSTVLQSFSLAGGQEPMIVCPGQWRPDSMGVQTYFNFPIFDWHGKGLSREPLHDTFISSFARLPRSGIYLFTFWIILIIWTSPCSRSWFSELHHQDCILLLGNLPGIHALVWLLIIGIQFPSGHFNDPVLV